MEALPRSERFARRHLRVVGSILLAVALAIAKWQVYDPIHGETRVHVWLKLILLAIALGFLGLVQCIFGNRLNDREPADFNDMSRGLTLVSVVLGLSGVAFYLFTLGVLSRHGYAVSLF